VQSFVTKNPSNLKISVGHGKKIQHLINIGPLIRLYGLKTTPKLINVGPMLIPDYRVNCHNYQKKNIPRIYKNAKESPAYR
jgi:hypothetical protein